MLLNPGLRDTHGELAHPVHQAHALGNADGAARVQDIEQVRAFQAEVEGAEDREAFAFGKQLLAICFWLLARASFCMELLRTSQRLEQ